MSAFNPETGILTASRDEIGALAALATGAREVDAGAVDAMLAEAGAGSLEHPHVKVTDALAPLRRPIVGVRLAKTGYLMPGWVGEGRFTLHVYRSGDDDQLVSMPAEHFVHFLLWLLDIGPRPRDERPAETAVDSEALNRAVALRLGDRPSEGLLPEPLDSAVAHGFRDWWLASSHWPAAPGAPGKIMLEVIDTDAGLWSVQQLEDGTAIVRPVTPLGTMLALGDLLPDGNLVDQSAPRLPLEDTPVFGGPVKWVADVLGYVPGYRFDTLGIVEAEPRGVLHEIAGDLPLASRAGVAVVGEAAEPDDTPLALTDRAMSTLDADALLIDWEPCELAGEPAVRTLMLEQLGGLATVVLEQWRLVVAGTAWTVTATADLAAWASLAGGLRDAVATLEVEP